MKIAIIVHSKTGHTFSVAEAIQAQLVAGGHQITIEKIISDSDGVMDPSQIKLKAAPSFDGYDLVILGGPVWGGRVSPVVMAYLKQQNMLQNMNLGLFLTQTFPFKFLGGKQAMRQFCSECVSKGAKVLETGIVNWSNPKRNNQIESLAGSMKGMAARQ